MRKASDGGGRGKEECWLVLEAKPGAAVALGLNDTYDLEEVRKAASDGSIEDMLVWHKAKAGDFFHVPTEVVPPPWTGWRRS